MSTSTCCINVYPVFRASLTTPFLLICSATDKPKAFPWKPIRLKTTRCSGAEDTPEEQVPV